MSRVLKLGLATALLGSALVGPAAVFGAHESTPDFTEALVANTGMTQAPFWEGYLADLYPGTTWDCTKVNSNADPVVLNGTEDALIIKAGNNFYGWVYPHAGSYSAPVNSTSHFYICDETTVVEDDVIEPAGEIRGPCDDPAYFAVFDNTLSTVAVRFRFTWYNSYGFNVKTKVVPGGQTFTTNQHWVKGLTMMRIGFFDTTLQKWVNLVKQESVKGTYPACVAPYWIPGFATPTPV